MFEMVDRGVTDQKIIAVEENNPRSVKVKGSKAPERRRMKHLDFDQVFVRD